MSFTKAFRAKVRAVRIRCSVNLFLRQTGRVLAVAGGLAIVAILVERLLALRVMIPWAMWAFWGVAATFVLVFWLVRLPSRMQASVLLDERLRLHERFSTTLALADSDDPFAKAARAESLHTVQQVDLRGHFPIGLSRSCYWGAGVWLIAVVLLLAVPQKDLLGFLKKDQEQQETARQLDEAKTEVRETAESIKAAVKQLGDPALEEELEKLDELTQAGVPQEIKREAIKAMGDLSEKIRQMQNGAQIEAANMLQQRLKRLHGSVDPFAQKIRMALAKGDFAQAANLLSQMQKQLAEQTLTDEKRKELAKQMQDLAKELERLAAQRRELEEELEKLGLDKKLAQLSKQQFQQMLEKQGLTPEMIEQLTKKMAACQGAGGLCMGLAEALGGAGAGGGGLLADELADAIDQLGALEVLQQQAILLQASYDEISRCMGSLGKGLSPGACQGPFQEGDSNRTTQGTGGPGQGFGPRAADAEGQTNTKTTRVNKESGEGPIIASWYFKDIQIKGESRRALTEVVDAGRASAAEAISENQIPRKYEDAMKKYFGQLEQQSVQP